MPIKLKIDLGDLIFAMQNRDSWYDQYLDLKDGEIRLAEDKEGGDAFIGEEEIESNPGRFLPIETFPSNDGFRLMEEFIEGVENKKIQEKLIKAISGGKPFRNFKDALPEFPEIREAWFKFEEKRMKEYALEWLKDNDIEIIK